MRVRLLGGFGVEGLADRQLGSRKGRVLLKVLAVAGGSPVSVERLADVLWGEVQPARPAEQVGVLVSRLRAVLGPERIVRSDAGYSLAADWVDVDEVASLAAAAVDAMQDGRLGSARAAADAALALARGPLLPDEEGEWVEPTRAAAAATVARVRRLAVDAASAAGDHDAAAALGEQALAADPYDEVVLRAVMTAHLAARRPAAALAAYARVRERLAEELGVPPTAETEALHGRALAAADGDSADARPRPTPGRVTTPEIVGRAEELAVLDDAFTLAAAGGAALVLVEGEPGIGKTALVRAWAASLSATVLWGRCDELGRDLPLQSVGDALVDHLRGVGADRAAEILGDEAVTLGPLLGAPGTATATKVADAEAGRARAFADLAAVVARTGDPAVLVVEDLHLAGPATLAWLSFARRRATGVALVGTTRPGGAREVDATHHIRLGPLDRDAVLALVGAERADELLRRSGGHPLLLTALAEAAAGAEGGLPATVRDVVTRTIASLGEEVATTLRVAAVLGPACDLELVARAAGRSTLDVLDHLEAGVTAGVLVEDGSRFVFRHALVREALDEGSGAARRALVHQQAARLLAGRPGVDPLVVAVHARAGGDLGLASKSFVEAASVAAARFDLDTAIAHVDAALDLRESPEAHVTRARLEMSRQAFDDAAASAARAVALGGGAGALEVAGWVAYYRRRHDEARAYADEAAACAGDDDALRASALALAGRVRHASGDLSGAVELLASVRSGPLAVRGIADVWLAQARVHQGRPLDALDALARPLVDPDGLAHPWAPLHLRFNRVLALGQLGHVEQALHVATELDTAVDRAATVGARFAAPAANAAAWVLRWSGRTEEADDRNRRALDVTGGDDGPSGDAMAEGHYVALLDLADGRLIDGDTAGAAALVARLEGVDTWTGTMSWHQRHRLGLLRARLVLLDGDLTGARQLALDVADDAAARGATRYELLARAVAGLADRAIAPETLAPVVDGLGRCAVLDGWWLVGALAAQRDVPAWRGEAERLAAVVVANAGDGADRAALLVDRVLRL